MSPHPPPPPEAEIPLALIVAVARNGVIGVDDGLPWALPTDLRHFRDVTMGKPVIMGRRTFASIGRPLPGRHLVVLSRDLAFAPPDVTVVRTLDDALRTGTRLAREHGAAERMAVGGGLVYRALMDRAQRLYVTEVDCAPAGDTLFPAIDPAVWRETARTVPGRGPRDEASCVFLVYERV